MLLRIASLTISIICGDVKSTDDGANVVNGPTSQTKISQLPKWNKINLHN